LLVWNSMLYCTFTWTPFHSLLCHSFQLGNFLVNNIDLYLTFPSLLVSCFYVLILSTLCYTAFNYCVTFMFQLHMTDETASRMYPQALGIYGNWLADTRSENPNIIMEEYMEKVGQCYIFVVNSFVKNYYDTPVTGPSSAVRPVRPWPYHFLGR